MGSQRGFSKAALELLPLLDLVLVSERRAGRSLWGWVKQQSGQGMV